MARSWIVLHKRELIEANGETCVNCGSSENVEWHHIVPLKDGGQNTIRNVVPLCYDCHMRIHFGNLWESTRRYNAGKRGGRPRKYSLDDESKAMFWEYCFCKIGTEELRNYLKLESTTHVTDLPAFKEFKKQNGIKKVSNKRDYWDWTSTATGDTMIGYCEFDTGKRYEFFFDGGMKWQDC